jgi:hypothetical protein
VARQISYVLIDAKVEAQFVDDVTARIRSTGNADHAAARDHRELPRHRAQGAVGRCRYNGFAGHRLADVEHAHVGGEARHAQCAQGT